MKFSDERLDIREGNELARYFAWLKHNTQIIRNYWEAAGKNPQHIPICYSSFTSTYGLLGDIADLDQAMTIYELSGDDSNLRRQMRIYSSHSYLVKSKLMRVWTVYRGHLTKRKKSYAKNLLKSTFQNRFTRSHAMGQIEKKRLFKPGRLEKAFFLV